ncbi:NUDIX domain-containing protein [Xenophilus arseniciresistens]|uniref:NUDIX domain-containing protein n=1 Tax=Xenophilus arseniciresistens TaxID=1283306 RepID=A0AAE3SZA6_9BURK|nr:NUDIX domain-containing protein [Xenophilus arseniciresistens]MDA7415072.1 NUDIX domain-containing protein [Xenophilus arseniciresistens]
MQAQEALPGDGIIGKACACLVDARGRLLVFDHPGDGGLQLPKGTIEPGETPEEAARRELLEESGLAFDGPLQDLGTLLRDCAAGEESNRHAHAQLWHLFLMRWQGDALPEHFAHTAHGSPEEDGLVFAFRWLAAGDALDGFALPYRQAIARVRATLLA